MTAEQKRHLEEWLEAWLERWLDAQLGKMVRWGAIWMVATLFGLGVMWTTLGSRLTAAESAVSALNITGGPPVQHITREIDSLRVELRYLPSRLADSVAARLRIHR